VLSTGCWGRYNGIIANSWIDPERGTAVYCVSDDDSPELPTGFAKPEPEKPVAKDKASEKAKEPAKFRPDLVFANKDKGKGFSPRNLLTGTLADQLKIAFAGKGKVIAVSLKERAAIVLGGHAPDGAYWWDAATGRFTTAKYYRDALPEWLNAFNKAGLVDSWQGKAWEKLLPDSAYSFLRPDNVPFEKPGGKFGPAFPHVLPLPSPGTTDPAKRITPADYYYCLAMTPYANDLLLDAVQAAVAAERIGQDEFPDLLAVSITANDYVGHAFGPYSHESLDITLRTDRQIEALLAYFDKTFGRNGYVLGLSADHGCMPEPGFAASLKLPTGTDEYKPVVTAAEKALADAFGDDPGRPFIVGVGDHMLYFNRRLLAERRIEPAAAERIAAEAVSRLPQVAAAFSGSQLATVSTAPEQGDDLPQLFARSRHPARSGNVLVALRPWRTWQAKYTANHGSIYGEDQHVPMIFFGAGVKPGRFDGKVGAVDFAPTMAALLDIPPPPSAQGRALRQAIK
jgi:predicted AlkP superfamily pyrophosphatase or phosphodiesterase